MQHPESKLINAPDKTAVFSCKFSRPVESVKWYHNDRELWSQKQKIVIETDSSVSKLVIRSIDHRDIGHYFVVVDDEEKSDKAELLYRVQPQLTYDGPTEPIAAGKHFDFTVAFIGYPPPSLEMLLDDDDLKLFADVETYDDFVSVRVKNVKKTCTVKITARNEHGEQSLSIPVVVFDVPSAPLNVTASSVSCSTATISWNTPQLSNGSDIVEYCVERKSVGYSRWRTVGHVPAGQLSFTTNDLFPNDLYAFRVSAVNSIGQGAPSKPVDVETPDEKEGNLFY